MKARICLVSPGHVASNPRLVKEANALSDAGYQVRVVAGDYMAEVRLLDKSIFSRASWKWVTVGLGTKFIYIWRKIKQKLARLLAATGWIPNLPVATWGHHPLSKKLAQVAAAETADLYIAHCLAALPAAAWAAKKHHAKFGFDAEDFHIGELADTPENQTEIRIRDYLERTLLPHCSHLTAASRKIAEAYYKRYEVKMQPILNVFPLEEVPKSYQEANDCYNETPSLYWFSQTIGAGRGLEAIVQAMAKMQTQVKLFLRGIPASGYQEQLKTLARELGVEAQVHFLPSAPPDKMIELAAEHDIGLSLELNSPLNRAICLTNKIFTYLLAELPVLMSRTPAQEDFAKQLGEAAILIDINDTDSIAKTLDNFLSQPNKLVSARAQARKLGQEVYNWDVEKKHFLNLVEESLR
jgi:glycosyltransferase involved in cell wall biosynthesis